MSSKNEDISSDNEYENNEVSSNIFSATQEITNPQFIDGCCATFYYQVPLNPYNSSVLNVVQNVHLGKYVRLNDEFSIQQIVKGSELSYDSRGGYDLQTTLRFNSLYRDYSIQYCHSPRSLELKCIPYKTNSSYLQLQFDTDNAVSYFSDKSLTDQEKLILENLSSSKFKTLSKYLNLFYLNQDSIQVFYQKVFKDKLMYFNYKFVYQPHLTLGIIHKQTKALSLASQLSFSFDREWYLAKTDANYKLKRGNIGVSLKYLKKTIYGDEPSQHKDASALFLFSKKLSSNLDVATEIETSLSSLVLPVLKFGLRYIRPLSDISLSIASNLAVQLNLAKNNGATYYFLTDILNKSCKFGFSKDICID